MLLQVVSGNKKIIFSVVVACGLHTIYCGEHFVLDEWEVCDIPLLRLAPVIYVKEYSSTMCFHPSTEEGHWAPPLPFGHVELSDSPHASIPTAAPSWKRLRQRQRQRLQSTSAGFSVSDTRWE